MEEIKKGKKEIMFFHLKPVGLALLMFLGFELAVYRWEIVFWVLGFLFLTAVLGTQLVLGGWRISVLPMLYFTGASLLLFFVSGGWFVQVFILVIVAGYYLLLLSIYRLIYNKQDETARRIEYLISMGTVFVWCASLFAVYLNRNVGFWVISLGVYLIALLISRQALETMVQKPGISYWLYSFVLAYSMGVLCWGVYFLPFGYLTAASLLLASFFVLTNCLVNTLKKKMTKTAFLIDLSVFVLTVGVVLVSARWMLFE